MRRARLALVGMALLGHGAVWAGEELMPMRGNAYSEVSSAKTVGAVRKTTSLDADANRKNPAGPQTQRNMVRVTLPSLGAKSESPPRLIEMDGHNLDGSLNFSLVRPAPVVSDSGIPGLVMPEILALDKYRLADPEPVVPSFVFPEPEIPSAKNVDAAARERALAGLVPLQDMPRPSHSPSFPPMNQMPRAPRTAPAEPPPQALPSVQVPPVMEIPNAADLVRSAPPARPVARATIQPSPSLAAESNPPLRIDLSARAPEPPGPSSHEMTAPAFIAPEAGASGVSAVSSLRPPPAMMPAAEKQSRRHAPATVEPPAVRVPGIALEDINVPGAGAMLPADMPYFPMPEPPPPALLDQSGATVETLREVLSPIYKAGKR